MMNFLNEYGSDLLLKTWKQLYISLIALGLGIIVAVPLGIALTCFPRTSKVVIRICSMLQTALSLALLALMIPIFGIGKFPAIVALFIYSLLPILRNTCIGMDGVDPSLIDSVKGMGMTKWQQLWIIEIPLSVSVIMAGIRNALVVAIGVTAIGAFIGAGGLGDIIIRGTNTNNGGAIILAGALPTALMAIVSDLVLGGIQKLISPKGLRE